ncbi:MAG: hypothetical protein D6790_13775, partial [Caldilineae bacterium]
MTTDTNRRRSAPQVGRLLHRRSVQTTKLDRRSFAASTSSGPLALRLMAVLIALAMLLPLAYLLVRASEVGVDRAVDLLVRPRTFRIILNSLTLTFAVTGAALVLSLPLAWLTVRTDLPGRRAWTVL